MLIARAPVRISFGGGGTDLAAYYERHGGLVISTAIDKYFYTIVTVDPATDLQVISADYQSLFRHPESTGLLWDGDLRLPRAILQYFGVRRGLNIFLACEVPPGTGLGSSSAAATSIILALQTLLRR